MSYPTKQFSDGEFITECSVDSAALICPDKKEALDIAGNLELAVAT